MSATHTWCSVSLSDVRGVTRVDLGSQVQFGEQATPPVHEGGGPRASLCALVLWARSPFPCGVCPSRHSHATFSQSFSQAAVPGLLTPPLSVHLIDDLISCYFVYWIPEELASVLFK